jgi:hypothetical protein
MKKKLIVWVILVLAGCLLGYTLESDLCKPTIVKYYTKNHK